MSITITPLAPRLEAEITGLTVPEPTSRKRPTTDRRHGTGAASSRSGRSRTCGSPPASPPPGASS
jgi:hypothetical protein